MGELDGHECHLDYGEWRVLREASRIHERTKAPQYYLELSYQVSFATVLLGLGVSFVTSTLWLADESLSVKVAGGTIAFTIAVLAAFLNIGRLSACGTLVHLGMIALASFGIATLRTYESWPFTAVVAGLYGAIVVISRILLR